MVHLRNKFGHQENREARELPLCQASLCRRWPRRPAARLATQGRRALRSQRIPSGLPRSPPTLGRRAPGPRHPSGGAPRPSPAFLPLHALPAHASPPPLPSPPAPALRASLFPDLRLTTLGREAVAKRSAGFLRQPAVAPKSPEAYAVTAASRFRLPSQGSAQYPF